MEDIVIQRSGSFPLESVFGPADQIKILLRSRGEDGKFIQQEIFCGKKFSEEEFQKKWIQTKDEKK